MDRGALRRASPVLSPAPTTLYPGHKEPLLSPMTWVVMIFTLALVVAAGVYAIRPWGGGGLAASQVQVPDLVGSDWVTAQDLARRLGLTPKVSGTQIEEGTPAGVVLSQDPPAGTQLREGDVVSVVLSEKPRDAEVPDVSGFTLDRAQRQLENTGFKLGWVTYEPSDDPVRGRVVRQIPSAGERRLLDEAVDLVLSEGSGAEPAIPPLEPEPGEPSTPGPSEDYPPTDRPNEPSGELEVEMNPTATSETDETGVREIEVVLRSPSNGRERTVHLVKTDSNGTRTETVVVASGKTEARTLQGKGRTTIEVYEGEDLIAQDDF